MKLKEIRKSKNITQKEAAELLGISLRTYKRYETDEEKSPSFKYTKIVEALNDLDVTKNKLTKSKKIAIAGIGYVGFSIGVLLSKKHEITMVDTMKEKVSLVNLKKCPFKDDKIDEWLENTKLNIRATMNYKEAYQNADIVLIATPTNFDPSTNCFDTSSVNSVYNCIRECNKKCLIVIKSTIPVGLTDSFNDDNIIFSPEFLREGHALEDNLFPSRIIVGSNYDNKKAKEFGEIMRESAIKSPKVLYMSCKEAESVKLFANSYLAMRVAYFNELDTYAEMNGLDSNEIIKGVSLDPRIGDYYNNPSFGYGGYCLPKDTEQLRSSFLDIPNNNLIKAIVESNQTRKEYLSNKIIEIAKTKCHKNNKDITIGVYRLAMKSGSDNFRSSAIVDIINILTKKGVNVIVYEPNCKDSSLKTMQNLEKFKQNSDIIVTNRYNSSLKDCFEKVYTRDLFSRD